MKNLPSLVVFFAVVTDPFGAAVVLRAVLDGRAARTALLATATAVGTAIALLGIAAVAAATLLDAFDVSAPSAQLAAAALLVIPASQLLWHGTSLGLLPENASRVAARRLAVVPVTVPILAGPAPVAATVAYAASRGPGVTALAATIAVTLASVFTFLLARQVSGHPGRATRLAGRFVGAAAFAVAFGLAFDGIYAT